MGRVLDGLFGLFLLLIAVCERVGKLRKNGRLSDSETTQAIGILMKDGFQSKINS